MSIDQTAEKQTVFDIGVRNVRYLHHGTLGATETSQTSVETHRADRL